MARTGDNIYFRNDLQKWEGRYYKGRKANGSIWYGYVSAKTREECVVRRDEKARQFEQAKKLERLGDRLSFAAVAANWLEFVGRTRKDSTICKYRNIIDTYLNPRFGECHIPEISREDAIDYSSELLAHGGQDKCGLSENTVKGVLSVQREVMVYGERQYHFQSANLTRISIGKKDDRPLRVLTENEEGMVLDKILCDLDPKNIGILTVLYTGLRLGEICALHWEDINFSEGTLTVHTTMKRIQTPNDPDHKTRIVITEPKSRKSERTIPLHPDLIEVLMQYKGNDGTFFLTGLKDVYIDPRTMENRFKKIIDEAGIAHATFHALRHTFATRSIENGMEVKVLSEILGHASVQITLDRYVHPSSVQKHKNMVKLPGFKDRMKRD